MSKLPVPGLPIEQQSDDVLAAMLVWGEARGEGPVGKLAVIWVAKNRVAKSGYPLRKVILRPYAFSCFLESDPNRSMMLEPLKHGSPQTWEACWDAAMFVLSGSEPDPTHGATHYCTVLDAQGKPLWGRPQHGRLPQWYEAPEIEAGRTVETARIGGHVFARAA